MVTKVHQELVESERGSESNDEEQNGPGQLRKSERVFTKSWATRFNIVIAGVALMSDGYQNNIMTATNLVFAALYPSVYTSKVKTRVSNALLIGEVIGQVVVGLSCDVIGRKAAIVLTTLCLVLGGIGATAAHGKTTEGMFWMITVMRGLQGFGVGGEYPASSVSVSEASNETTKRRGGIFVLVTNLPLSLGGPFSIIVFLIVWECAGGYKHLNTIWRVVFGIGCVWPLLIFIFRYRLATTELYRKSAVGTDLWKISWLTVKYYWRRMIGTCGAWFLYDFITFPNGIFSGTIIQTILGKHADIKKTVEWQLLLGFLGIPGVLIGAFLCDRIGRKYTMMTGFTGYIVFGLIIGLSFEKMAKITPLFIVFYGLFNSCGNLGPGDMLGLVSSESYATSVRGTLYGLSAAVGKSGAAIGTQVFTPIQEHLGVRWTFIIAAIVGGVGVAVTFLFIPHLREDDLMNEDIRFAEYLRKNGYTGQIGMSASDTIDNEIDAPVAKTTIVEHVDDKIDTPIVAKTTSVETVDQKGL